MSESYDDKTTKLLVSARQAAGAGQHLQAADIYAQIVKRNPTPDIWMALGDNLGKAGKLIESANAYEKAYPDKTRPMRLNDRLTRMFIALDRLGRAKHYNDLCLAVSSPSVDAILRQADLLRWGGHLKKASFIQDEALTQYPNHLGLIAACIEDDSSEIDIDLAENYTTQTKYALDDRRHLAFALTRYFDRQDDVEKAWHYADLANSFYPVLPSFSNGIIEKGLLGRAIKACSYIPDEKTEKPNLIYQVGAPRTGGTLLQTMLARSPGLCSVGERAALLSYLPELSKTPDKLLKMRTDIRRADIAGMRSVHPDAQTFIDKTPHHVFVAGLLDKLHSGARFVDTTRNQLDTTVSIYFHDFSSAFSYARNIQSIGKYLALHKMAVKRWREAGLMIWEHNHDAFLKNPSSEITKTFKSLGLSFKLEYLQKSDKDGPVKTFSTRQIRGEISDKFEGRGQRYAKYLEEAGCQTT